MSPTDPNKPSRKPGQRSRKADQRNQKPDQPQSPGQDQQDAKDQIGATAASTDDATSGAVALADSPSIGAGALVHVPSIGAVAPAHNSSISIRAIANAYEDYSRKSFQETKSFVEKLMEVRSLDKAIEIQAEFAWRAYETFVAESQKICELYSELAKQLLKPWEGFVAKVTQATR